MNRRINARVIWFLLIDLSGLELNKIDYFVFILVSFMCTHFFPSYVRDEPLIWVEYFPNRNGKKTVSWSGEEKNEANKESQRPISE